VTGGGRLTLNWLKDALRDLEVGTRDPGAVISAIESDARKLWTWPEFQELRARKLAGQCGECGATADLALQHLIQPKSPVSIRSTVEREYTRDLELGREYHNTPQPMCTLPAHEYVGCPGCGDRSYYERKTMRPRYRCVNGRPPHTFDEPVLVQVPTREVPVETFSEFVARRRAEVLAPHRAEIEARIARSAVQQLIAYFSGHGVVTACKRCAYRYDAARLEGHRPQHPAQLQA
jgi:hypothetical protein